MPKLNQEIVRLIGTGAVLIFLLSIRQFKEVVGIVLDDDSFVAADVESFTRDMLLAARRDESYLRRTYSHA